MAYDVARSRVVLVGGAVSSQALADTWEFDGMRWTPGIAPPPALGGRAQHAMAYDAVRRRTVLFGGYRGATQVEADTWEYTGVSWLPGPAAPAALEARAAHAMVFDADRARVVLFGGTSANGTDYGDTWEYDGSAWVEAPVAGPSARLGHAMAYDSLRRRVVLFGGIQNMFGQPLGDVWEYDGTLWLPAATPPAAVEARFSSAMTFHEAGGALLLMGGYNFSGGLNDAWLYDGVAWVQAPDIPSPGRYGHALAYDAARARSVSFGGGYCQGETMQFDGTSWLVAPDTLVPHAGHALAYDSGRNRVVLHGGRDQLNTWLDETWELSAAGWTKVAIAGPGARVDGQMAYDIARGRTVLFAGDGPKTDTWEYDGAAWSRISITPPANRGWQDHSMAYDALRQRVVVFGGRRDATKETNATWEYDGTTWTIGGAAPPTLWPRHDASMAYDVARGAIVLFGGLSTRTFLNDTWEYDGSWTVGHPAPVGFAPRSRAGLAPDPPRGVLVLFGGTGATNPMDDTWEYGPNGWSRAATAPAALVPRFTELVYCPALGGVVMFGGETAPPESRFNDTWIYGTPAPPPLPPDIVVGQGLGQPNPNRVRVFTAQAAATSVDVDAYAAGAWGVNVATGAIDVTAEDEVLSGPGPGAVLGPQVRAFAAAGTPVQKVNYYAYGTLRYGVNVASAPIDGDAFDEMLTAPGPGTVFGPHVRGFDYDGQAVAAITKVSFFAFGTLQYGANVAGGDADGDGYGEILAGPGPGPSFAAQAKGFDYDGAALAPIAKLSFQAFPLGYGLELSAGDMDADGFAEIVATPGAGPANPAQVLGFDYDATAVSALAGADVTPYVTFYGARTSVAALLPDTAGREEVATGAGRDPAAASTVFAYRYMQSFLRVGTAFLPFSGGYGVNVALGRLGY